ncbi:facilitated trehalose transporter Tret1-2 homolog [Diorhabda sublineata]|uniref:facilitated trehalose transporter Tret1-2 homolog n=1 Tax=Diorhabda sublineata TaxID=1163346 RepID=UPI0024E13C83|nr:facilitated trehalose transporter Tret1-2 homolog [Diorhabda sublineata]
MTNSNEEETMNASNLKYKKPTENSEIIDKDNVEVKYLSNSNEHVREIQILTPADCVRKKDTLFLYFVVLTGTMSVIVGAGSFVWTSPVVPKLISNNTDENPIGRPATTTEISLIAGLPFLTMIFGSFLLGSLSEMVGRKRCLQFIGLGMFVSAVIVAFSTNVIFIIIFRCVLFMFYNGVLTVYPIYLTEICEDHNRAKYGCLMGVFLPFGNLYSYILGSFFNVRSYSLLLAAPLAYFLVFFFFAPESPVYSSIKGHREESLRALKKLRNNKTRDEITEDYDKISNTIRKRSAKMSILEILRDGDLRYGMILALGPVLVQNLSGVTIVMAFMAPIFNAAGFSGNYMSIIVGAIKVITITCTSFVVEKTGRRKMLFTSAIGTGFPLLILGIFFYLQNIDSPLIKHVQWLPLPCVICNVVMYSVGLGPIPMAIMSELFVPEVRSVAVSIVTALMGFCIFITTTSYPFMVEILGIHWCVWMYSCVCFLGAVFIYFVIPETKGKSLLQIQQYLKTRNFNQDLL